MNSAQKPSPDLVERPADSVSDPEHGVPPSGRYSGDGRSPENQGPAATADSSRGGTAEDDKTLVPIIIRVNPENIVYLKFLLESYEGVGVMRTLCRQTGEIAILATVDTLSDVEKILAETAQLFPIETLDVRRLSENRPTLDWLLEEFESSLEGE